VPAEEEGELTPTASRSEPFSGKQLTRLVSGVHSPGRTVGTLNWVAVWVGVTVALGDGVRDGVAVAVSVGVLEADGEGDGDGDGVALAVEVAVGVGVPVDASAKAASELGCAAGRPDANGDRSSKMLATAAKATSRAPTRAGRQGHQTRLASIRLSARGGRLSRAYCPGGTAAGLALCTLPFSKIAGNRRSWCDDANQESWGYPLRLSPAHTPHCLLLSRPRPTP